MKIEIKNISNSDITLFIKKEEVDSRVTIAPGNSMVADDYETKTMIIFKRKNLITISPIKNIELEPSIMSDEKSVEKTVEKPNETPIETPSSKEVVKYLEEDLKYFQDKINTSLGVPNEKNTTRLDIVEGEVEQYIEDGYVKGEWSSEEVAFLKKNYPTKGRKYCSNQLNRNETSVQKKINSIGLKKKKKTKK
jgi:hypothetical protein